MEQKQKNDCAGFLCYVLMGTIIVGLLVFGCTQLA